MSWMPPHHVDTAIMGPLNGVMATTAVPDVNDFDAPACHLQVSSVNTPGIFLRMV